MVFPFKLYSLGITRLPGEKGKTIFITASPLSFLVYCDVPVIDISTFPRGKRKSISFSLYKRLQTCHFLKFSGPFLSNRTAEETKVSNPKLSRYTILWISPITHLLRLYTDTSPMEKISPLIRAIFIGGVPARGNKEWLVRDQGNTDHYKTEKLALCTLHQLYLLNRLFFSKYPTHGGFERIDLPQAIFYLFRTLIFSPV